MKNLKISVKQVNEANENFSLSEFNAQIEVHSGTGNKKAIGTMLTEFKENGGCETVEFYAGVGELLFENSKTN